MKDATPRCEDVADKLVRLFGWRQTYPVQKLQKSILPKQVVLGRDSWVGVRTLRASSGGILDPDDLVRDVADDRETLSAECELQLQHNSAPRVGDGASGSSVGTASPDMFRGGNGVGGSMRVPNSESCVEVSEGDMDGAGGLQVRRGSEPTLHQDTLPHQIPVSDPTKRWSAAVVCREESRLMQKVPPLVELPPDPPPDSLKPHAFQRQSNRLSMQFSGPGSGNWLDAAERVQSYGSKSLPRDSRKDPLGQDTTHIPNTHRVEDMLRWVSGVNSNAGMHPVHERHLDLLPEVNGNEVAISGMEVPVSPTAKMAPTTSVQTLSVSLVKGEKGLGFTITTRDNPTGGHCPIYIKNILPKGAAVMDGRLRAGDRLVSVNGIQVSGLNQQQVVTLLRNTPTDSTVNIVVERNCPNRTQKVEPQPNPPHYVEKSIGSPVNGIQSNETSSKSPENGRVQSLVNAFNQNKPSPPATTTNGNNPNSSRGRISKSSSKDELSSKDLNSSNAALQEALHSPNSVLGLRNRLILRLDVPVHDSEKAGLGISVKGKVTVGPDPQDLGIFIKSVLHGGAASRDGRLHMNDQLLSVNGVSLVGQSNAEAMETLRRALIHSRPHVHGSISLTIARRTESMDSLARWKDDTPPSNESSTNTTDNSNSNFTSNTVILNTNGPSHTDKENHNKTHNKSNDTNHVQKSLENSKDRAHDKSTDSKNSKRPTIVTINNNSWVKNQSDDSKGYLEIDKDAPEKDGKRDSFEWSRLDGWNPVIDRLTGLRNESYYMATQTDGPVTNGHGNLRHGMGHAQMHRSPPIHNVIIEEDYGTSRVGVGASAGVSSGGAAPWESGSESGEGAFSRDAVGRRSMSEKRHAAVDAKATTTYKKIKEMKAINALQVGPALGMRKSSSLESLQTAIQETHRMPRHEPIYTRAHAPLKHWLTDDHPGAATMVRGSPQQSSLSHKKPSLLKSISTMLRFGKPHKKESELYHRSHPGRSSEKSISREAVERHTKLEERTEEPRINPHSNLRASSHSHSHSRQASGDRGERADKGEGQGARLYVHPAPPYRMPPARTSPAHMPSAMDSAWGPSGHYVNYDEIQQNLKPYFNSARREKLSEVQIGQMRRQVHAQRAKAEEESRRAGVGGYHSQRSCREAPRPQSNYYEYETVPNRQPGKLSHYH